MKENIKKVRESIKRFWTSRTKTQKSVLISSCLIVITLIIGLTFMTTKTNLVPLYNNLSVQETGQIKEELDGRGIDYEIEDDGTSIRVPESRVDDLLVDLAGQGIPTSGNIDYSFFSENSSWGITDNEFNMMKLDATQTELANLIKGIDGIEDAKVMINMPEESVFINEAGDEASASIVLDTQPGYEFKGNQMESLYHLVSKAIPELPADNIVIMNQYSEYFDRNVQNSLGSTEDYTYQQTVKKDTERDIQRRLQQMIGTMVGMDRVIVSVTADIDFTKENRVEEIVDPVDLENMEGLPASIETIHETYSGNPPVGGVAGTGDEDITGYQAETGSEDGEYEIVKETINNEFNHIHKEIIESPYKVRDLGVQVAVDNVVGKDGDGLEYLSQQDQNTVEAGISSILSSIIGTSIDKEYGEIIPDEKVSIVFQEFSDQPGGSNPTKTIIPLWMYISGAILLLIIILLSILLFRKRKDNDDEEVTDEEIMISRNDEVPDMDEIPETQTDIRKKQLAKMAEDKPEDFAKLLRSWIADD